MLFILNINDFNKNNLIFSDKIKNNILQKGEFYRIYYSDEICCLNAIYLNFDFKKIFIEPYFNKIKCIFNKSDNQRLIKKLITIEKDILSVIQIDKKIPVYRIQEQLINGFIKIISDRETSCNCKKSNINILLKVSGIWTNEKEYGITFRFFFTHPLKMI
jgi:hypothetical protein